MDLTNAINGIMSSAAHNICAVVIAWAFGKLSDQPAWAKALKDAIFTKTVSATATDKSDTK